MDLKDVFNDYVKCEDCQTCKAAQVIPESNMTYCSFLMLYRVHIERKIEKLLCET